PEGQNAFHPRKGKPARKTATQSDGPNDVSQRLPRYRRDGRRRRARPSRAPPQPTPGARSVLGAAHAVSLDLPLCHFRLNSNGFPNRYNPDEAQTPAPRISIASRRRYGTSVGSVGDPIALRRDVIRSTTGLPRDGNPAAVDADTRPNEARRWVGRAAAGNPEAAVD